MKVKIKKVIQSTKKSKMKKNRLSKKLEVGLNSQMTKEASASQIYLSYASWAAGEGI